MASLSTRSNGPFPADKDYGVVKALMYGKVGSSVVEGASDAIRAAAAACAADKAARCAGKVRSDGDALARSSGQVLLYYKYVAVSDPPALRAWQRALCGALDLRGRIHVGAEGINGTVGGTVEATGLYIEAMRHHAVWSRLFADTEFKVSPGGRQCFPNLFVRICTEICQMNCSPEEISWRDSARHLSPREFHDLYAKILHNSPSASTPSTSCDPPHLTSMPSSGSSIGPTPTSPTSREATSSVASAVILDVRNYYESAVGRFNHAVRVPTRNFSEFPEVADKLIKDLDLKNKSHVLLYCTGGIRCERASAYLQSRGVTSCYQLHGGIHRYCEEIGDDDSFFRGRNFVFDRRLTTRRVGSEEDSSNIFPCSSAGESSSSRGGDCIAVDRADDAKNIVGMCTVCEQKPWDTYDSKLMCEKCSALVLICADCRSNRKEGVRNGKRSLYPMNLLCEQCKRV